MGGYHRTATRMADHVGPGSIARIHPVGDAARHAGAVCSTLAMIPGPGVRRRRHGLRLLSFAGVWDPRVRWRQASAATGRRTATSAIDAAATAATAVAHITAVCNRQQCVVGTQDARWFQVLLPARDWHFFMGPSSRRADCTCCATVRADGHGRTARVFDERY